MKVVSPLSASPIPDAPRFTKFDFWICTECQGRGYSKKPKNCGGCGKLKTWVKDLPLTSIIGNGKYVKYAKSMMSKTAHSSSPLHCLQRMRHPNVNLVVFSFFRDEIEGNDSIFSFVEEHKDQVLRERDDLVHVIWEMPGKGRMVIIYGKLNEDE